MKIFLSRGASAFEKEGSQFGLSWCFEVLSGAGAAEWQTGYSRWLRIFSIRLGGIKEAGMKQQVGAVSLKIEGRRQIKFMAWLKKNSSSVFLIKWVSYQYAA